MRSFPTTRTGPGSSTVPARSADSTGAPSRRMRRPLRSAPTPGNGPPCSTPRSPMDGPPTCAFGGAPTAGATSSTPPMYATCTGCTWNACPSMLDQDDPLYANWDQDRAALDGRYAEQDPAVVADELVAAAGRSGRRVRCRDRRAVGSSRSAQRRRSVHGGHLRPVPGARPGSPSLGRAHRLIDASTVGQMSSAVVEAAVELAEIIEAHADEAEQARRLPPSTVSALVDADLMRMCLPREYGGPEVDPVSMTEAIMHVAHADGAAGWCSMIASTTSSMAAFLPADGAEEIYRIRGGHRRCLAPNGQGTTVDRDGVDGVEVSGRWAWGSGTQHCAWVLGGATMRRRHVPAVLVPAGRRPLHRHVAHGRHARIGVARLLGGTGLRAVRRTMQPGVTRPVVDNALVPVPQLHVARGRRRRRGSRCRTSSARRTQRHRTGQAAAVLVADARAQLPSRRSNTPAPRPRCGPLVLFCSMSCPRCGSVSRRAIR